MGQGGAMWGGSGAEWGVECRVRIGVGLYGGYMGAIRE